jgi:TolB protein
MNADGSNVVRRTIGANLRWATWSPDGRTLAVTYGDWYHAEIHLLSVKDDGLPPRLFAVAGRSPQWSPDGQRIVYVTTSGDDGYHQVFVANVDGTGHRELTVFVAGAINGTAWSPSGDRIAYPQCLDGRCNLYVVNADGSGTRQVAANADHAAWSPDGRWIAFTHNDVRVISPGGDGQRLLIANGYSATWRP